MSGSPDARWTGPEELHNRAEPQAAPARHAGPPTRQQRRAGSRVAIGIMLAALLVIILLDHYGILH